MNKFISKALILVFGLSVATSFTACHSGEGATQIEQDVPKANLKHSVSGTILKADGTPLNGASVKINGASVSVVNGNTFSRDGLSDGPCTIEITCNGYKDIQETLTLAIETVNGKSSAMNVVKTYYLAEDVATTAQTLGGAAQTTDEVVVETTSQKDADGNDANDTDESITVAGGTPEITGDANDASTDLGNINQQIKDQSNGTEDINDFKITLTNITSLEDALAVARANKVAASRMTRATTAMPNNNELLAGVAVNAGAYVITMPSGKYYTITIKMPDDVKGAISLFRTFKGDAWTPIDMKNPNADGIHSIDISSTGVIKIQLSKVQTQSFGFGVIVGTSVDEVRYEDIVANPITNGATARSISSMPYTVKTGVVLTQSTKSSLTDFLRKIVVRKYSTRIVKAAKEVSKNYVFSPAYQMHANGVLYLQGWQEVKVTTFSIQNNDAKFTATEYGDAFVAPYEVWEEYEVPTVHGGGSN